MKPSKAHKLLIISLAGSLLIGVAAIWFMISILSSRAAELSLLKSQADVPATQYAELLATKRQLKDMGDVKDVINSALPSGINQSMAIAEINKLANKYNITINSLNFNQSGTKPSKSAKSKQSIPGVTANSISLTTGTIDYNQLMSFLQSIENNRWIMQPSSISIQPSDKNPRQITSLMIELDIYSSKDSVKTSK